MGVRHLGDLTWLSDLDPVGQDHVLKHLVADEVCACGHLDEEHDADSACMANNTDGFGNMLDPGSFAEPHYCHAYNPIQQ